VKRGLDIAVALTTLVVLAPLFGLIAVLIKVCSPGPVLSVQERVGYDTRRGTPRPFNMYKFRSMHYNAEPAYDREHLAKVIWNTSAPSSRSARLRMKGRARITGLGRILRKTGLDELPQLINVLKGDMSLVGPRPALLDEIELYEDWHKDRLLAVPGITGFWQVKARSRVSFDEMVRMDLHYIEHMSLGLDLEILLLTPLAVILGDGVG
jgi:lipopolysaccharide/colanic/teichoic acid biosynthesis glycosyltransferase